MMSLRRIGFIGLGKMGGPMVRRLLGAGYAVVGNDIRPDAVAGACRDGAEAGTSPEDTADGADVVITMLPDARAVEHVVYDGGLARALRPGQILLEMTSSAPRTTRRIASDLVPRGVRVLDAPVSGGVRGATEGTLCIMAGGPADVLSACRPVLECFGQDIVHVGDSPGDGDTAKTINNLLSATTIWSALEALVLGVRAGLEPDRLLAAINRSTGRSYTTETKLPQHILPRRFDAGFTIGQYMKDLTICQDLADDLAVPLPLGTVVRLLWRIAVNEGMADLDHTALVTLLERWMGAQTEPR